MMRTWLTQAKRLGERQLTSRTGWWLAVGGAGAGCVALSFARPPSQLEAPMSSISPVSPPMSPPGKEATPSRAAVVVEPLSQTAFARESMVPSSPSSSSSTTGVSQLLAVGLRVITIFGFHTYAVGVYLPTTEICRLARSPLWLREFHGKQDFHGQVQRDFVRGAQEISLQLGMFFVVPRLRNP